MPLSQALRNRTTGALLSPSAFLLTSVIGRMLGRLAPGLPPHAVVGLSPCDWIHTWGVRRALDVAYCDRSGQVIFLMLGLPPNRLPRRVPGTQTTWEADAGDFAGKVALGDILELVPDSIVPIPGSDG